jgi:cysteine desulfurase
LKSGDVFFANPASQHALGKLSRKKINEAREEIYSTFSMKEGLVDLLFHSGATEGFSTFAHSFVEWTKREQKNLLICFSEIDHPAVTSLEESFKEAHVHFYRLPLKSDLSYDDDKIYRDLETLKKNDPSLVILYHHLWVHNETGFVSPLENLEKLQKMTDLYLHIDGVQAPGKIPDWRSLPLGDIWTFSAHKFGALKGIGFSFFKKNFPFLPLIRGGGQQRGLRSGTENVMGVWSLYLALKELKTKDIQEVRVGRQTIEKELAFLLQNHGEVLTQNEALRSSNTIYFYLSDLTSDISLAVFDLAGLEVSAGSACSSGAAKDSAILLNLGKKDVAKNGLRLSLGFEISQEQIEEIIKKLKTIFSRFNAHSKT